MHLDVGTPALSTALRSVAFGGLIMLIKPRFLRGKFGLVPISGEVGALGEHGGVKVEVDDAKDALPHTSPGLASLNEDQLHFLCQCPSSGIVSHLKHVAICKTALLFRPIVIRL